MACDSCGDGDSTLVEVHRVYVTPAAWDTEGNVRVADETEQWCSTCLVHYPHQVVSPEA